MKDSAHILGWQYRVAQNFLLLIILFIYSSTLKKGSAHILFIYYLFFYQQKGILLRKDSNIPQKHESKPPSTPKDKCPYYLTQFKSRHDFFIFIYLFLTIDRAYTFLPLFLAAYMI